MFHCNYNFYNMFARRSDSLLKEIQRDGEYWRES